MKYSRNKQDALEWGCYNTLPLKKGYDLSDVLTSNKQGQSCLIFYSSSNVSSSFE